MILFRFDKAIFFIICGLAFLRGTSSFSFTSIPYQHVPLAWKHSSNSRCWPEQAFSGITGRLSVISDNQIEQNMESSMDDDGGKDEIKSDTKDQVTIATSAVPTYKQLLLFTATTVAIWLSESVLSLVDTTIIGLSSSSKASKLVQLAALGPATTLYDTQVLSTYFLAIATTNQLAPLLANKKWRELQRRTSELMGLAALLGFGIMISNFVFGEFILQRMVGSLTEPQIVPLAKEYIWIRSLVTPMVLMGWVSESFCLTSMDTKTPGIAVLAAACFNVVGDLALVPFLGVQGAAIATALAAFIFSSTLIRKVHKKIIEWKENEKRDYLGNQSEPTENGSPTEIPFLSLPSRKDLIELLRLAGPIFFFTMGDLACHSGMKLRAPKLGILNLATHNIMSHIYFFFSCFGIAVGQASQTLVPRVAEHEQGKVVGKLFSFSTLMGLFNFIGANLALRHFSGCFTNDSDIAQLMKQFAHYVGTAALIHPFTTLMEGVLLVKRDMKFLVGLYCTTMIAHFGFLFSPFCKNFRGLWQALVFYESIRVVQFAFRLWQKSKQKNETVVTI